MTKKHYEMIAAELRIQANMTKNTLVKKSIDALAQNLAFHFTTDNPKFDRARFLEACGTEQS